MNTLNTPILFLIFNRLDTTKKVFETIKKNKPSKLYIASDGARAHKQGEKEIVQQVRDFVLENIDAKYRLEEKKDYRDKTYYNIIFNAVSYTYSNLYYIPIKALKYLEDYYDEKSFTDAFLIKNMVAHL